MGTQSLRGLQASRMCIRISIMKSSQHTAIGQFIFLQHGTRKLAEDPYSKPSKQLWQVHGQCTNTGMKVRGLGIFISLLLLMVKRTRRDILALPSMHGSCPTLELGM